MSRPDGGAIAGMLTGALLGVAVAMSVAPPRPDPAGELLTRGRAILDAAAAGLPLTSTPGV